MATKPSFTAKKALRLLVGNDINLSWVDKLDELKILRRRPLRRLTENQLLQLESEIGAEIFGPIPEGRKRSFFCLDDKTWLWYEEWKDASHRKRSETIRYEISDKGVLKVLPGPKYSYLEGQEFENFAIAVQAYYERVAREVYHKA